VTPFSHPPASRFFPRLHHRRTAGSSTGTGGLGIAEDGRSCAFCLGDVGMGTVSQSVLDRLWTRRCDPLVDRTSRFLLARSNKDAAEDEFGDPNAGDVAW